MKNSKENMHVDIGPFKIVRSVVQGLVPAFALFPLTFKLHVTPRCLSSSRGTGYGRHPAGVTL